MSARPSRRQLRTAGRPARLVTDRSNTATGESASSSVSPAGTRKLLCRRQSTGSATLQAWRAANLASRTSRRIAERDRQRETCATSPEYVQRRKPDLAKLSIVPERGQHNTAKQTEGLIKGSAPQIERKLRTIRRPTEKKRLHDHLASFATISGTAKVIPSAKRQRRLLDVQETLRSNQNNLCQPQPTAPQVCPRKEQPCHDSQAALSTVPTRVLRQHRQPTARFQALAYTEAAASDPTLQPAQKDAASAPSAPWHHALRHTRLPARSGGML